MRDSRKTYRVELLALAVVVIGILLLIDFGPIVTTLDSVLVAVVSRLSLPGLIGLGLVIGAAVFLAWRLRVRFLHSAHWRVSVCPKCGNPIDRVHRSWWDKVLSKTVLPHARRYRCANRACGWTGLRHARRHGSTEL